MTRIETLSADAAEAALPDLAALLHACVLDGASIGFVLPFTLPEAEAFWRDGLPALRSGARRLLVARHEGRVVASSQIGLAAPANGRHRAEITKVLVHPQMRRRGLARALMREAEAVARAEGRLAPDPRHPLARCRRGALPLARLRRHRGGAGLRLLAGGRAGALHLHAQASPGNRAGHEPSEETRRRSGP